jgi:hypothetical protein
MTEPDNEVAIQADDEAFELCELANSILKGCKETAPLSDLETSISLFRQALDRRPAPHPLRSDSISDLAVALVTRFSLANQRQDLEEAKLLRGEQWHNDSERIEIDSQVESDVRAH